VSLCVFGVDASPGGRQSLKERKNEQPSGLGDELQPNRFKFVYKKPFRQNVKWLTEHCGCTTRT
jgi:hypothetical protein